MPKMTRTMMKPMVLQTKDDNTDLTFWGDIYETRPVDLWTGEEIDGDFILLDEVITALNTVKTKNLTIHLSSYGGDAGVSNTIHNKLREMSNAGTKITCIVDGVAMSGGSLIMCAADTVKCHPASLIMIHKAWTFLCDAYNADEMRAQAKVNDAWDKAQIEIYQRKTGLSRAVLDHMMSDTTYMTGREAVEKGFADELIEDAQAPAIAASADRRTLYVNGRPMRLHPGAQLPETIKVITEPEAKENAGGISGTDENTGSVHDNTQPATAGQKEENPMTLEELREQYPDLYREVECSGAKAAEAAAETAVNTAVKAERDRLASIDEVASLFPADLVQAAKYGDRPMTAQELTYQAAVNAAKAGRQFIADMEADNRASNANDVPAASNEAEAPKAQSMADAAKEAMDAYLKMKKEVQ